MRVSFFFLPILLLSATGPAFAQTWRYFGPEYIHSAFAPPTTAEGAYLCVIEGWTPQNSGFPERADKWNTHIFPIGPTNPDALSVVLDSIEGAATGLCDFVAVPWYEPKIHAALTERLNLRSITAIPDLDASNSKQSGDITTTGPSPEVVEARVQELGADCKRTPYGKTYFDCSCVAEKARARIIDGVISVHAQNYDIMKSLYEDPALGCVDTEGVKTAVFEFCENQKFYSGGTLDNLDCNCAQETALAEFLKKPGVSKWHTQPLFSIGINPVNGQLPCRAP